MNRFFLYTPEFALQPKVASIVVMWKLFFVKIQGYKEGEAYEDSKMTENR